MSEFRQVSDTFWASEQIAPDDVTRAREQGFALIINNRPEGEVPGQPAGDEIAAAARSAGLAYCAIPVTPGGFSEDQVEAMAGALESAQGPVLAYCRSGTRSTLLWSLAQAREGEKPETIAAAAAAAGFDVTPIRPLLDRLAAAHG